MTLSKEAVMRVMRHVNVGGTVYTLARNTAAATAAEKAVKKTLVQLVSSGTPSSDELLAYVFAHIAEADKLLGVSAGDRVRIDDLRALLTPEEAQLLFSACATPIDPNSLAPYVPSPRAAVIEALEHALVDGKTVLLDVGCGEGHVLEAALSQGAERVYGTETDATRYRTALGRLLLAGVTNPLEHVFHADIFGEGKADIPWREITHLYAYWLPATMAKMPVAAEKLSTGTWLISLDFPFIPSDRYEVVKSVPLPLPNGVNGNKTWTLHFAKVV